MKTKILLQLKFLVVQFLNSTINLFPVSLRSFYLKLFGIKVYRHSSIHRNVKFFHIGNFKMGKNSTVNFGCYLDNRRGISIGNNVGIAHDTKIYTLGHDLNDPHFKTKGASVSIEDNVFIFSNCLIMPGITIHEGAIILAGSVVTKDVFPYTIVGGNPAKYIKERSTDIKYSLDYNYWFAL
ncbi:acyltransferase [Aquirufa sp. 5-AUSEE-100C1]